MAATVAGASPEITLIVDPLLEQEGDGLAGVRAQLLGQHHEPQRPQPRGRRRVRAGGRQRGVADGERQHAPAGLGLRAGRAPAGGRPGRSAPARPSTYVRPPIDRPLQRRRDEKGTLSRTGSGVPGYGRRDRLERRVAARRAGGVAAEQHRELALVGAVGGDQLHDPEAVLGEGAGLVDADRVHRRQRLDRVELLAERAAAGHPQRRDRVGDPGQQHQPLGDDRDDRRDGRLDRLAERRVLLDQRPEQQPAERHHGGRQDQDQPVEGPLQGRARVAELARLAGQALGVGVAARRPRRGRRRSPRPRTSPPAAASPGAARDRLGLAGEDRLVDARGPRCAPAGRRRPPGRRRPRPRGRRGRRRSRRPARGRPSRTTVAVGATRAASRSRLRLARASCTIPMPALMIRIPRKRASRQSAKISVIRPKTTSTTLKTVSRLARRMLRHERLVVGGSTSPRAARRRAASCSVRPSARGGSRSVSA